MKNWEAVEGLRLVIERIGFCLKFYGLPLPLLTEKGCAVHRAAKLEVPKRTTHTSAIIY
jgi:hypothetical protein